MEKSLVIELASVRICIFVHNVRLINGDMRMIRGVGGGERHVANILQWGGLNRSLARFADYKFDARL